ncbi:MAG: lipid IV(A) 3-deoxy-D-manno-octulosonic acid transferase [Gammaproteobacteria bacterium]
MQRAIYTFLFYLAVPAILLRLWWRARKSPGYGERIGERFGRVSPPANYDPRRKTVWIHAVSVGESVAAVPLVRGLLAHNPDLQIVVTTMTPTGSDRVREAMGDTVMHVYVPYDLPGSIRRFLKVFSPEILILMETELWPNIIQHCRQRDIKVILANGRMSARSARSYKRFRSMTRNMMESIHMLFAQSLLDATRFKDLGALETQVLVSGSLKFHVDVSSVGQQSIPLLDSIRASGCPVIVAGSTREGEESKVLTAYGQCLRQHPQTLLLLVPRHPERFESVTKLAQQQGYAVQRRSNSDSLASDTQVIIGDSMGEMLAYYSVAWVVFVGGSLVDTGCQNVLEPLALGRPVLIGPSQFNFADICRTMEEEGALLTVLNEQELGAKFIDIIGSHHPREEMPRAGKRVIAQNQDALPRVLAEINAVLNA